MRTTVKEQVIAATALRPLARKALAFVQSLKKDELVDAEEIAKHVGCSKDSIQTGAAANALFNNRTRTSLNGQRITLFGNVESIRNLNAAIAAAKEGQH